MTCARIGPQARLTTFLVEIKAIVRMMLEHDDRQRMSAPLRFFETIKPVARIGTFLSGIPIHSIGDGIDRGSIARTDISPMARIQTNDDP